MLFFTSNVDAINLNGGWGYKIYKEEGTKSTSTTSKYNLSGYAQVTDLSFLNYMISYGETRFDRESKKNLKFTSGYNLINDIFGLNLSYTASRRYAQDNPDLIDNSLSATIFSTWQDKRLPRVIINYGINKSYDDITPHNINTTSKTIGLNSFYSIWHFKLNYNLSITETENDISKTTTTGQNHMAAIKFSYPLKDYMTIFLNLHGSYNKVKNEQLYSYLGKNIIKLIGLEFFAGVDSSPEEGTLNSNPQLGDGNFENPTGADLSVPYQNIAIKTDYQRCDYIFVYLTKQISDDTAYQLRLDIYKSDDGDKWELIKTDANYEYSDGVYMIDTDGALYKYIKIVVINNITGSDAPVSEVEAFQEVTSSTSYTFSQIATYKSYKVATGFTYKIFENFVVSSSFMQTESIPSYGKKNLRQNYSLSSAYKPFSNINLGANLTFSRSKVESETSRSTLSYTLSSTYNPITPLSITATASWSMAFSGISYKSKSSNYKITTSALIFEGLSATLENSLTESKNIETDQRQKNIVTSISTNMLPYSKLNVFAKIDLFKNLNDSQDSRRYMISANWYPSDALNIMVSRSESTGERKILSESANLSLGVSRTVRVTLRYSQAVAYIKTQSYSLSATWVISNHFSLRFFALYNISEGGDKNWSSSVNLSAKF